MGKVFYEVDSAEASWNTNKEYAEGNIGHRPKVKGGYFPVPPVDSLQDIRSAMVLACQEMGLDPEVHHHEVGTAGQCEIGVKLQYHGDQGGRTADLQVRVVHNVAHIHGMTATFMPKPLVGDNGSGMHCHQSLFKGGNNLFAGDEYGGLSETALYYWVAYSSMRAP
jgi:glutamine synthetase